MNQNISVLIVDDEPELRKTVISILTSNLSDFKFSISEANSGKEALSYLSGATALSFDLILMDVRMPELNGLEALRLIKENEPRTFVVMMTAHSNLNDAVIAIKDGAYDYIEKPVQASKLSQIVKKAIEARALVSSLALSNPIFDDDLDTDFVGNSSKMKEIFNLIYRLCKVDTTVLIRGENGTGKELVAKAIHYNSPKKEGQLISVNCGAIPEALMESEFFGHEKGAFTGANERKIGRFQLATNGTLFLDEIGELKPEMQVKLLRVLQEKKFTPVGSTREVKTNARIIAATNRNLEKMIEDGHFREDLFYRLNVMPLFLPSLRDRKDDIADLVQHFIKKFNKQMNREISHVSSEAVEVMTSYRWPGNIRELENVIERAFIIENSNVIGISSLPDSLKEQRSQLNPAQALNAVTQNGDASSPLDFEIFREQSEKEFIVNALKANHGRINQTVAHANIPKNTLLRKIKKYGIQVKDYLD